MTYLLKHKDTHVYFLAHDVPGTTCVAHHFVHARVRFLSCSDTIPRKRQTWTPRIVTRTFTFQYNVPSSPAPRNIQTSTCFSTYYTNGILNWSQLGIQSGRCLAARRCIRSHDGLRFSKAATTPQPSYPTAQQYGSSCTARSSRCSTSCLCSGYGVLSVCRTHSKQLAGGHPTQIQQQ